MMMMMMMMIIMMENTGGNVSLRHGVGWGGGVGVGVGGWVGGWGWKQEDADKRIYGSRKLLTETAGLRQPLRKVQSRQQDMKQLSLVGINHSTVW